MDRLLRAPAPGARSRLALALFKSFTLAALLCVMVTQGPTTGATAARPDAQVGEPDVSGCEGALVRTAQGDLQRVSFAVGWDVYTGRRAGTLVVACLGEESRAG